VLLGRVVLWPNSYGVSVNFGSDGGWKNEDDKMRMIKCGWKNAE